MHLDTAFLTNTATTTSQVGVFQCRNRRSFSIHLTARSDDIIPPHFDHFFILGCTIAFILQDDYSHPYPVSPLLKNNIIFLLDTWSQWYREKRPIRIDAPISPTSSHHVRPRGRSAFFSGGIDSLFTCVTLGDRIDSLITVAHTPFDDAEINRSLDRADELTAFATATNRQHFAIATNMMHALPEFHDAWTAISHGPALASVAHFLSNKMRTATISSSHDDSNLIKWGSHPLTDPLLSSDFVRILHYGSEYTRVQKTAALVGEPDSLRVLSVCGLGRLDGSFVNCSQCQKCLRTMVTLDLLDVDRSLATTFDWSRYSPDQFGSILLRKDNEKLFAREIVETASARGRDDIAHAVARALSRSRRFKPLADMELLARRRAPWLAHHKEGLLRIRSMAYSMLSRNFSR